MDELTFLLILAGIGVVLLVAMFTYYKHHKKIHDEIQDFNHHAGTIDDILLQDRHQNEPSFSEEQLGDEEFPGSFSASKQDNFDITQVDLNNDAVPKKSLSDGSDRDQRKLVDGVYINTKRVISKPYSTPNSASSYNQPDTFSSENARKGPSARKEPLARQEPSAQLQPSASNESLTRKQPVQQQDKTEQRTRQIIKIVYTTVPEGVKELIISHTILAKGEYFKGQQLFNAIQAAGLVYGEMGIFHYPGDDHQETFALFSLANVVEPGTFNLAEADTFTTPGISMFMRLPTRIGSSQAYEKFIHVAEKIAGEMGGELCDETRSQLTQQTIAYKKEQIRKLNFDMAKAEKLAGKSR